MTRIAAAVLLFSCALPQAGHAAFIFGGAVFEVAYRGSGEPGDSFEPPLPGLGSFVVRSLPYHPNAVDQDPSPPSEFDVLDFFFSFNGQTWDESDVSICQCAFTPDGAPLGINFDFDNGVVAWILSWNFEDGNFGFQFHDTELDLGGTSEDGIASGGIDTHFRVLPEPGSSGLLLLGLIAGGAFVRRRHAPASPATGATFV